MESNCVCAWCGAALGWKAGLAPGDISHGICPDCSVRVLADLTRPDARAAATGREGEGG